MMPPPAPLRRIDLPGAVAIVIANMVGTGVFTSLGYQLVTTEPGFPVLLIWLLGGLLALLGAVCYAEIATRLPEDGGEYHFLTEIYHPGLGFMAGFTSATVGFAAPVAMAALALASYLAGVLPGLPEKPLATAVVLAVSALHAAHFSLGLSFQKLATALKVTLILALLVAGWVVGNSQHVAFNPLAFSRDDIWNPALAVNLVWVSFAYSGWNASAYLAGEIIAPERNLSRSILYGTSIVTVLYVALNGVFMSVAPADALRGVKEVGLVASTYLFGPNGGKLMSCMISLLLISTISSMMLAGPRVIRALFASVPGLRAVSNNDRNGNPVRAIAFQALLAVILLQIVHFDTLLYYTAFTLSLFTVLTVAGVIVLRVKRGPPVTYRAFAYPLSPLLFVTATLGIGVFFAYHHPLESLAGLSTALMGFAVYLMSDQGRIDGAADDGAA